MLLLLIAVYERDFETVLNRIEVLTKDRDRDGDYDRDQLPFEYFRLRDMTYNLMGRPELAKPEFQAALERVDRMLTATPNRNALLIERAEVLAGLERREEAVRFARLALDSPNGEYRLRAVLNVFLPVGDLEASLAELDNYLSNPGL